LIKLEIIFINLNLNHLLTYLIFRLIIYIKNNLIKTIFNAKLIKDLIIKIIIYLLITRNYISNDKSKIIYYYKIIFKLLLTN